MKNAWHWRRPIFDEIVKEMGLQGAGSVIDLGCSDAYLKIAIKPNRYLGVGIDEDPTCADMDANQIDVVFDLDTDKKWPWKDREFELCVASQVLEHILRVKNACKEIKRITRSRILIGLPNDMRLENRVFSLFGRNPLGVSERAHCRLFDTRNAKSWVESMFGDDFEVKKVMLFYASRGNRILPRKLQSLVANSAPNLFAGEIYFLLQRKKGTQ